MPIANAQTLPNTYFAAFVHSFHCPNPRQPQKSFRWVGGRGPENAHASDRGRLGTDIYDGQTKWRRKTT